MTVVLTLLAKTLGQVWHTLTVNWPFLAAGLVVAAVTRLYLDPERVARFLQRHQGVGVLAATGTAVAMPLCSCGTTAVILGMMANQMPWAPIVAFMVASPLTSPEELVYSGGLFGWRFAWTFLLASVVLGLAGGWVAWLWERSGWLSGQARPAHAAGPAAGRPSDCCGAGELVQLEVKQPKARPTWRDVARETLSGARSLVPRFVGFAFVGYLLNNLIPAAWIGRLFGAGQSYGVPLAATLGLPLYFNTESSLPLLKGLMDGGMSQGAGLAFLITGAGTSAGAVAGALTIARWRVVALVVAVLWVGALGFGWGYNALLAAGAF
jgi:hypothetical protein